MISASAAIDMASRAVRPWRSIEAELSACFEDNTTQAQKDFCLYSCPYTDDCACCDKCDGCGNLRVRGRPRAPIDASAVLDATKKYKVAVVSRMFGVSRDTVYRLMRAAGR